MAQQGLLHLSSFLPTSLKGISLFLYPLLTISYFLPWFGVVALFPISEVGTWTWTWMEPMIGTASFVLLSFQLIRSHMQRIDLKPFGRYSEIQGAGIIWLEKSREREREAECEIAGPFSTLPPLTTLLFPFCLYSFCFSVESRRADFLAKKVN